MSDSVTPSKTPSIAIGVAIYLVLSLAATIGTANAGGQGLQAVLGGLACLIILLAPMAAVWHYTSTHSVTMLAGPGAGLGAIVGSAGALLSGLAGQALMAAGVLPTAAEQLQRQREQMLSDGMDPAQVEQAMQFAEQMSGATGNPLVGIAIGVVFGAILGALGGALGAVLFKKGPATS